MLHRDPLPDGRTRLTFILPAHDPAGEVSVVGTFNDWQPGAHHLVPTEDGMRSVSVVVEPGMHHFRYLATGGVWADEFDADSVTAAGSIIDCPAVPVRVEGIEAPSKPARTARKSATKSPGKKSATKKSPAKAAVATSAATTGSAKASATASTTAAKKTSATAAKKTSAKGSGKTSTTSSTTRRKSTTPDRA